MEGVDGQMVTSCHRSSSTSEDAAVVSFLQVEGKCEEPRAFSCGHYGEKPTARLLVRAGASEFGSSIDTSGAGGASQARGTKGASGSSPSGSGALDWRLRR